MLFEQYAHSGLSASYYFNLLRYLTDMIRLRTSVKDLRGIYRLEIPRVNTTTHGPHSFRYSSAKRWNDFNESVRALDNFKDDVFQNV